MIKVVNEIMTNEVALETMGHVLQAAVITAGVYGTVKFVEKKMDKRAEERQRYNDVLKRENERRLQQKEKERVSKYFNITRERYEGPENRDHWVDEKGKVKFLKLDFMNMTNQNAKKVGAF